MELLSRRPRIKNSNGYNYHAIINGEEAGYLAQLQLSKRARKKQLYRRRQKILGEQWSALPPEIRNNHYSVFMTYHHELIDYMGELEEVVQNAIDQGYVPSSSPFGDGDGDDPPSSSPPIPRVRRPVKRLSPSFKRRKQPLFPPPSQKKKTKTKKKEKDDKQVLQDLFPSIFETIQSSPLPEDVVSHATLTFSSPSSQETLMCHENAADLDMLDKILEI